jgi:hypothetical protein
MIQVSDGKGKSEQRCPLPACAGGYQPFETYRSSSGVWTMSMHAWPLPMPIANHSCNEKIWGIAQRDTSRGLRGLFILTKCTGVQRTNT